MEITREFTIRIEITRDTNKATYRSAETFETYDAALRWLHNEGAHVTQYDLVGPYGREA